MDTIDWFCVGEGIAAAAVGLWLWHEQARPVAGDDVDDDDPFNDQDDGWDDDDDDDDEDDGDDFDDEDLEPDEDDDEDDIEIEFDDEEEPALSAAAP